MLKKLLLITGAILIAYLILVTVISADVAAPAAQAADSLGLSQDEGYVLRSVDGCLSVFRDGELCLKTDTQVAALPKADRVRLEEGIYVYSAKELKKLLEDYCS